MALCMTDKGYDFPLHSLDLMRDGSLLAAQARCAIAVPQGLLVVPPALHARGVRVTTAACETAVAAGLAVHAPHVSHLASFGLDLAWATNMRHWCARMQGEERAAVGLRTEGRLTSAALQDLVERGQRAWVRLSLSARLCGKAGLVTRGKAPRARLQLLDVLGQAAERADEHAAALAEHGYGATQRAELRALIAALAQAHESSQEHSYQAQRHADMLMVMRGALLGDLSRLSQAAPTILPHVEARALRMGRLLPRRRATAAVPR